MYYISENRQDLIDYNNQVVTSEGYDGVTTTNWANIITHKNGSLYAIRKHPKYTAELNEQTSLPDWHFNLML